MIYNKRIVSFTIMLVILLTSTRFILAEEIPKPSGVIDFVLIEIEDGTIVSIPLIDYLDLYDAKSGDLYEFLKGNNDNIKLFGIVSGKKYIGLINFLDAYDSNPNDLVAVLESVESIKGEVIEQILQLDDIIINLTIIRIGEEEAYINGDEASVVVPYNVSENIIRDIEVSFSNPIKVTKINGKPLLSEVKKRLIAAGYDPEGYYSKFLIKTGWSYNQLAEIGDRAIITVTSQKGYEKSIYIYYSIESTE